MRWGERLVSIMSPEFKGRGEWQKSCVGAGIGTHEVAEEHIGSGRVAAAGGEVLVIACPDRFIKIFDYAKRLIKVWEILYLAG
jgi:hypothetical protein